MEHRARSIISALVIFLGLLFPLRFPGLFWPIVSIFSVGGSLLTFWVFGEKPTKKRFQEDWFTIIFVFIFILFSSVFSYLVPHPVFQATLLGLSAISVYYIFLVGSRLKRGYIPSLTLRNIIYLLSIVIIFMATSVLLKWLNLSGQWYVMPAVLIFSFLSAFVIAEFLYESQGVEESILYSLALSFGITQIIWFSSFWLVSYPQPVRITNIGVPLPAIVAALFFYLFWGISHHRLEGTLTKKVLWEYILIAIGFLGVLLFTTTWIAS